MKPNAKDPSCKGRNYAGQDVLQCQNKGGATITTVLQETHQLLDDGLDERCERQPLVGLQVPDVLAQDGNGLGVGLGLEGVAALLKNELELLIW